MSETLTTARLHSCLLLLAALVVSLALACSEGELGTTGDGDEAEGEGGDGTGELDGTNPDGNDTDTADLPDDGTTDGDGTGELDGSDIATCTTPNEKRCSGDTLQTCFNGVWIGTPCSGGCANNACLEVYEFGTCASPQLLSFPGLVKGTTDTTSSSAAWSKDCGYTVAPSGPRTYGPESVYELMIPSTQMVKFTLTPLDPGELGLYLRSECTSEASEQFNVCGANEYSNSAFELTALLNQGKHFVFVDTFLDNDYLPGRFELKVEGTSMPMCGQQPPTVIDLSSGQTSIMGNTADGMNMEWWRGTECDAFSGFDPVGPEVIYAFSLSQPADVTISATPTDPASAHIYLYVRTECEIAASQIGCHAAVGTTSTLTLDGLEPGTYYIYVDSLSASDAPRFTLSVRAN